MDRAIDSKSFIVRAVKKHGDRYDYTKVSYINTNTPVEIVCRKHGSFFQEPCRHIRGQGCPKCAIESTAEKTTISNEEFILRARKAQEGKGYLYASTKYIGALDRVVITCSQHGDFLMYPGSVYRGEGCPICRKDKRNGVDRENYAALFISKAKILHGDKYDYSKVNYKTAFIKVCIVCPIHGEFLQSPHNHCHGKTGCPSCHFERFSLSRVQYVESKGECLIANYLDSHSIPYIREKSFSDCKRVKPLPFDFYLNTHNVCIEFDGLQHLKSVAFFGGDKIFKALKENDAIKDSYCRTNAIRLIRISYKERNNIEKILDDSLMSLIQDEVKNVV